jgi:hypothetical protein
MSHTWREPLDDGWWTTFTCTRCGWRTMDKSGLMPCTDGPNPWCPSELPPRECPHTVTHGHLSLPSVWGTPKGMAEALENVRTTPASEN